MSTLIKIKKFHSIDKSRRPAEEGNKISDTVDQVQYQSMLLSLLKQLLLKNLGTKQIPMSLRC